jgi:hypothetical protein
MRAHPLVAQTALAYGAALIEREAAADRELGRRLLDEARRTAEALGLRMFLERVQAITHDAARPPAPGMSGAASASRPPDGPSVFRRDGHFWTVAWEGRTLHLQDLKGFRYLAYLLRHPGREIHALALAAALEQDVGACDHDAALQRAGGDAGPVLDAQARQDYRRRVAELREDLEEAERCNDLARATQRREELDVLVHELAASVGLGGRARRMGSSAERARINITKTVLGAIRKIDHEHPGLGRHLRTTVRTGTFFSYTPDSRLAAAWVSS